jgi:ribosome-associated protein
MDSKKLALLCRELADNKKAENLLVLDVRKLSSVTDYFVIVSGTSAPHLRAIVNEIVDKLRDDHELRARALDGNMNGDWVVLDYFDVIVHVMRAEVRERYDLEGLWGDAPQIKPGEPDKPGKATKAAPKKKAKAAAKRKTTKV